jgi:hypothetical protein
MQEIARNLGAGISSVQMVKAQLLELAADDFTVMEPSLGARVELQH